MTNNCVALESLILRKVVLDDVQIAKLENILQNVESLEVVNCWIRPSHLATMSRATKKLKHFVFYGNTEVILDLLSSFTELVEIETIRRNSSQNRWICCNRWTVEKVKESGDSLYTATRTHSSSHGYSNNRFVGGINTLTHSTWFIPRAVFFTALNEFANFRP